MLKHLLGAKVMSIGATIVSFIVCNISVNKVPVYNFTDWRWKSSKYDPKYEEILRLFQDRKGSCYSIHQIGT